MKSFITFISIIISMLLFILFVKLILDNQERYLYAIQVLLCYLVLINLYGFAIMYMDKRQSKKSNRGSSTYSRISERQLFTVTALGGSIGTILGMRLLRHKSKKTSFKLIFSLITLIEVGVIIALSAS